MSTKKKVLVLVSMVVLLVATTTLNIVLGLTRPDDSKTAGTQQTEADFYAAHRALRASNLDSLMLYYDSIINNENLEGTAAKEEAATQKLALLEASRKQDVMESAVKALGFDDAVVTIDTTGTNIYVVVKSNELTVENCDAISAVICDADPNVIDTDIRIDNVY